MGRRPKNMPADVPETLSDADRATAAYRAGGKLTNGPSDELILKHMRLTDMAATDDASGHAKYMAAMKAAEQDGVDIKTLKRTRQLKKQDLSDVISALQKELHYLFLRNMPVTQMELFPDGGSSDIRAVTQDTIDEAKEWDADDQGFEAAKAGRSKADHGYPAGSPQFAAWRRGWNRYHAANSQTGEDLTTSVVEELNERE